MSCKTKSCTFNNIEGDDVAIFVRQLPATKALDLQIELLNVMGTEVFPFIHGEFNFSNILRVMAASSHTQLSDIVKRVVCFANKDGKEVKSALFDTEYNGDLMLIWKVFAFVCEVNFKDFFRQGLEMNAQNKSEGETPSSTEEQK
jgi:hypothetical protein